MTNLEKLISFILTASDEQIKKFIELAGLQLSSTND